MAVKLKHFVLIRIRTEDRFGLKVYDFIGIGTKDMPRLGDLLLSQSGLEQQMDQEWETLVSTRIGTGDRAHWETVCLDQDWNGGPTTTGKLLS